MKGLLIIDQDEVYSIWASALKQVVPPNSDLQRRKRSDFPDIEAILHALHDGYDFIMLPLTLSNYNSLRFAELANRFESNTRIILCSSTEMRRELLECIFDNVIMTDDFSTSVLKKAFSTALDRNRDFKHLESCIKEVLENASCFVFAHFHGNRHPTIDDYKSGASPKDEAEKHKLHILEGRLREQQHTQHLAERLARPLFLIITFGGFITGVALAVAGVYLVLHSSASGESEIHFFGQTISSKNAGVSAIFIGGTVIVVLARRVLKSLDAIMRPVP